MVKKTITDWATPNNAKSSPKVSPKSASNKGTPKSRSPKAGSAKSRATPKKKTASPVNTDKIKGRAICFSGVFVNSKKSELEEDAKAYQMLLRSAVSSKTDYLVYGAKLEDGRDVTEGRKYRKALDVVEGRTNGIVKMFNEKEWATFLSENLRNDDDEPSVENTPVELAPIKTECEPILWVDLYRPRDMEDIISNGSVVRALHQWLKDWTDVCIRGNLKPPKEKKRSFGDVERINARAAILSGSPGIGKTSAAAAVAKALNMRVIELNASDNRSAKDVDSLVKLTLNGRSLINMFQKGKVNGESNTVLIFDEMDGLSEGDRGGAASLSILIDTTLIPIICICNDIQNQKLKPIVRKCLELKFSKPNINEIEKRLSKICQSNNFIVEKNAMLDLLSRTNNDIRAALNELQGRFMAMKNTSSPPWTLKYVDLSNMNKGPTIHASLNEFDVVRILLNKSTVDIYDMNGRSELFFANYDLMPKFMQQNYIHAVTGMGGWGPPTKVAKVSSEKELTQLEAIKFGANCLAMADIFQNSLWTNQNWRLLPDIGFYSVVALTYKCSNLLQRPMFPESLGKISTRRKHAGLLQELSRHLVESNKYHTPRSLRTSGYMDVLYYRSMEPIVNDQDVAATLERFDDLGINRDLFVDNVNELRFKIEDKIYESIDSATKMQLTRQANSLKKEYAVPETAGTKSTAKTKAKAKAKRKPKAKKDAKR